MYIVHKGVDVDVSWCSFDEYYKPFDQNNIDQDFDPFRNNQNDFRKDILTIIDYVTGKMQKVVNDQLYETMAGKEMPY